MSVRIKQTDADGHNADVLVGGRVNTDAQIKTIVNTKIKVVDSIPSNSVGENGDIYIVHRG